MSETIELLELRAAERLEQAKWIRRHVRCPHLTP